MIGSDLTQPWFIGFAPVSDPTVAVAVTIDTHAWGVRGHGRGADRSAGDQDTARGGAMTEIGASGRSIDGRYTVHLPAGLGWDGRRVPRRGPAARPQGRAEAAAPPLQRRTRASSNASGARPRRRRGCSTRTSSASMTAARSTDTYYIAMEYLPGRSLKQLIRAGGAAGPDPRDRHHRSRSSRRRGSPTAAA